MRGMHNNARLAAPCTTQDHPQYVHLKSDQLHNSTAANSYVEIRL